MPIGVHVYVKISIHFVQAENEDIGKELQTEIEDAGEVSYSLCCKFPA